MLDTKQPEMTVAQAVKENKDAFLEEQIQECKRNINNFNRWLEAEELKLEGLKLLRRK